MIDLNKENVTCPLCKEDEIWLWNKNLWHLNLKYISKLSNENLVTALSNLS